MQALQLTNAQTIELREVAQPDPGPGEVLVKVGAAGACHSDLHLMDAPPEALEAFPVPFTLGHENAGWVEALGAGVDGFELGQPVAVYGIIGCGRCPACLRGRRQRMPQRRAQRRRHRQRRRDGTVSERAGAAADSHLGSRCHTGGALTDAGLTPYHAIELSREALRPGSTCVVVGVGGLGHMAIQILRATTTARIIAVDVEERRLSLAEDLGAHHTVRSDGGAAQEIRKIVGPPPGGANVVLDFVSVDETLRLAADVVSTGGRLTLVGLGGGTLPLNVGIAPTIPLEARLVIPFWGTRQSSWRS